MIEVRKSGVDRRKFKGVIFDLDEVVVKSCLDFKLIRREIFGSDFNRPLLEEIKKISDPKERNRAWKILEKYEREAALTSKLNEHLPLLIEKLNKKNIKISIVTRNSRESVEIVKDRFKLNFDFIVTRDDALPKPAKEPVLLACKKMELKPENVIFIGDYEFDMISGKEAGVVPVLLKNSRQPFSQNADIIVDSLKDVLKIINPEEKSEN
ncbi:MAG: HAD family hydrolase [Candidatus Aerophobetes bacterium]|nr:HAD family hydrolase [Candidatus Aerophobetes bacterium]